MRSIFRKLNYPAAAVVLSVFLLSTNPCQLRAQEAAVTNPSLPDAAPATFSIAEEWTANVLPARSFSIGSILETGLGSSIALGIDPAALAIGAKTLHIKWQVPKLGEDDWAVGLKYVHLSRKNLWWGDVSKHFEILDAKVLRPSISWSNRVSKHLVIHSFWAIGIGETDAALSPYGLAELDRHKEDLNHPDRQYEIASKTMQFQSLAGLTEDRFQVTAEWERGPGERILLSTRLERTRLESLDTFSARITLAQHWVADGLNLRLGAGPQYSILSGSDLDDKPINATRWLPAADLAVYYIY
jgi:hypothetical protein